MGGMMAIALLGLGAMQGCKGGNNREKAQQDYLRSLDDSIAVASQEIDSCHSSIEALRHQEDVWMRDFQTISNPREAGAYMVYADAKGLYPPKGTTLVARLADNGQFELIGNLANGRFDQITVTGPESTATSDVVAPDQALNYTVDGTTTVLFTGPKVDEIGQLIADNELNEIKVTFLNGKAVGSTVLGTAQKRMITASYELYAAQKETNRLERRMQMLTQKVNILRLHKERQQPDTLGK